MMGLPLEVIILITLGGGMTLFLILSAFIGDSTPAALKKRMERVSGRAPTKTTKQKENTIRRDTSDSSFALLDKLIKSTLPNPQKLRRRLDRTGKNISLGEYLSLNGLAIFIFYLVYSYLIKWDATMSIFAAIASGLYLPHMITGRMGNKRVLKFLANFPEAIDTMCRGLRSGLPITETISTIGNELPDPIGLEFKRISDGVRMGRTLEDSMWDIANRLDTPEFRFFIIALAIQRETGGNLAETLGNLGDLLRKRRQLKLKIKAMSSEAKASAMIIGSLPFLMFALLYFVNNEYIMILLEDDRGQVLFSGGLIWLGMGVGVMKQMINFEI